MWILIFNMEYVTVCFRLYGQFPLFAIASTTNTKREFYLHIFSSKGSVINETNFYSDI